MNSFYYVFRPHTVPSFRHTTFDAAHDEALRLAEKHPGHTFEILKCVAFARTTKPEVFYMTTDETTTP